MCNSFARAALVVAVGSVLIPTATADDTPLQRLQNRSADARWKEARNQWIPKEDASKETIESLPSLTPSSDLLPKQSKTESPKLDTTLLDGESIFELPAPLFTPGDTKTGDTKTLSNSQQSKPVQMSAKPFPTGATSELAKPARSVTVPNPYDSVTTDTSDQKAAASEPSVLIDVPLPDSKPAATINLAQRDSQPAVGADPNTIAKPSRKPVLRSISDIQPFHDYSSPLSEKTEKGFKSDTEGSAPTYLELPQSGTLERHYAQTYYHWMASNLKHDPLYFEDVALERYGHTYPAMQPFVSVSKFGLQFVGLPYQMALNPIDCEQYALGYYRPGDCPPFLKYRIPFNKKAAATAAGAYTGLIFLLP